jgi:hypothetical protein
MNDLDTQRGPDVHPVEMAMRDDEKTNRLSESLDVVLNEIRLRLHQATRTGNLPERSRLFALHEDLVSELESEQ